jgi:hypothetical protein
MAKKRKQEKEFSREQKKKDHSNGTLTPDPCNLDLTCPSTYVLFFFPSGPPPSNSSGLEISEERRM